MADNDQVNENEDIDANEDEDIDRPQDRGGGKSVDPFDRASRDAEKELGIVDEDEIDDSPVKAKPKTKPLEAKKEKARPKKEVAVEESDDEDSADGDDDDIEPVKPVAKAKVPKGPMEPKSYWGRERREAFQYQPEHIQAAWLEEEPTPNAHWTEDQKAAFVKQPREVKEAWLSQSHALEKGFGQRFEALAQERKLAEGIRHSVTPQMRSIMQQRGIDEVSAFKGLMELQRESMEDPVGYLRNFIMRNKIDPRVIFGESGGGNGQENSQQTQRQADLESHPTVRALKAEVEALRGAVSGDFRQREEEQLRRTGEEMQKALQKRDERGNSAYPYVRLLHGDMTAILARIQQSDPERFASMGVDQRLAESYALALEGYPELKQMQQTAAPAPIDESDDEDADTEENAQAARLKKAATKKTRTPQTSPSSGRASDPFDRASAKADKQLGNR